MAAIYCQKEDAVYGRGLYATRRVPAGSTVLAEVPIVHVVKMAHKACQMCLSKPHDTPLLGCAGCHKRVWYCGKDCQVSYSMSCVEIISSCFINCQKKDWPFHREECKGMADLESKEVKRNITAKADLNHLEQDINCIRVLVRAIVSPHAVGISDLFYV